MLMFYDGGRIVLTISIIGNGINTLICPEEQKTKDFCPKIAKKRIKDNIITILSKILSVRVVIR